MGNVSLVRAEALDATVPYAYAAVTAPGSLVFTAGACPLDEAGDVVAVGDVAGQAEAARAPCPRHRRAASQAAAAGSRTPDPKAFRRRPRSGPARAAGIRSLQPDPRPPSPIRA